MSTNNQGSRPVIHKGHSDTPATPTPDTIPFALEGEDTCTAMTDEVEGVDACLYGDGVGYCGLIPGHKGKHLCVCTEHGF